MGIFAVPICSRHDRYAAEICALRALATDEHDWVFVAKQLLWASLWRWAIFAIFHFSSYPLAKNGRFLGEAKSATVGSKSGQQGAKAAN